MDHDDFRLYLYNGYKFLDRNRRIVFFYELCSWSWRCYLRVNHVNFQALDDLVIQYPENNGKIHLFVQPQAQCLQNIELFALEFNL